MLVLSYLLGPFVQARNEYRFFELEDVLVRLLKNFLVFYISIALIDTNDKANWLSFVLIITAAYLTYWANFQYISGLQFDRIHGPRGIYHDENVFAVLFVVSCPFFFYMGHHIQSKIFRYLLWTFIPFAWHSVFLTESRGGLLGLSVVVFLMSFRLSNRLLKLGIIIAFIGAFIWQGGTIMRQRANTIESYREDSSAIERIEAWKAAAKMIEAHPITGVGLASMGQAYPSFSNYPFVRVAHNTFLQLSAESGIISGLSYLFLIFSPTLKLWKLKRKLCLMEPKNEVHNFLLALSDSCIAALAGFFVCSLFLSLQEYEAFYFLLILANFGIVQMQKIIEHHDL